jgi:lipopolysaccharide transport system ATP-binding protein
MQMRLAFAVATAKRPDILIVDEALAVGDELFQRKCLAKIQAMREKGTSILFVSHSGATVIEVCDRAVLLNDGECVGVGVPKQVVNYYHKFLYAPAHQRQSVLSEIKRSLSGPPDFHTHASAKGVDHLPGQEIESFHQKRELENFDDDSLEGFDAGLVSQSALSYQSHGAQILEGRIFNKTGVQVNRLVSGRTYRFEYKVHFTEMVECVRFGMLIKTKTGLELGGGVSAASTASAIPKVQANSLVQVAFYFICNLNPGLYFFNAGVYGKANDIETYLHRYIDVCVFRVEAGQGESRLHTGYVKFYCNHSINYLHRDHDANNA